MVTPCGDVSSGGAEPAVRIASSEAAPADLPEPLTATTLPPGGAYRQKQSPPSPVDCGSTTASTAQAATAASTALPPARNTSIAVSEAIGMEVAAIPFTE